MPDTAKLFTSGRSQALRLPKAYRFDVDEVYIRRDAESGDVILSLRPPTWDGFFELLEKTPVPKGFLGKTERRQSRHDRDPLDKVDR